MPNSKYILNKPRPLKIVLSSTTDIFTIPRFQIILRNSPPWANICIASDRTSTQRNHMNKLRQQRITETNKNENDLIIKYVRSVLNNIINKK